MIVDLLSILWVWLLWLFELCLYFCIRLCVGCFIMWVLVDLFVLCLLLAYGGWVCGVTLLF